MPWVRLPIWYGSLRDAYDLEAAISHNCTCRPGERCGAHAALFEQRFLDMLLFERWLKPQLLREEFDECSWEP